MLSEYPLADALLALCGSAAVEAEGRAQPLPALQGVSFEYASRSCHRRAARSSVQIFNLLGDIINHKSGYACASSSDNPGKRESFTFVTDTDGTGEVLAYAIARCQAQAPGIPPSPAPLAMGIGVVHSGRRVSLQ